MSACAFVIGWLFGCLAASLGTAIGGFLLCMRDHPFVFGVAFLGRGYRNPPCLSSCFEGYGALQHPMSLVVVHSVRHLQWELGVAPLMPPLSPPKEMRDGAEAYYIGDNTKQQTYRTCIVTVGGPNTHHKPSLTKVCFDVIPVRVHVELKLGLIQPCTLVDGL